MQLSHASHAAIESTAVLALAASLTKFITPLASLVAVVWYTIVIWESPVGKRWRIRWRNLYVAVRERRALTAENRVMLAFLGLGGTGFFLTLLAIQRIIQVF